MMSVLPTPPRTLQKDKENHPPTPVTPSHPAVRTPRIAWSQDNLHHTYTTHIRALPSSSCSKPPRKSILKKTSTPLMPLNISQPPTREITPEPVDPLQHPLYFNSPVFTIITSLSAENDGKISLSDLTEAYSVLSARLKAKAQAMLDTFGPIPALDPLRENRDPLFQALRRDIGRAFIDPQTHGPASSNESPLSTPTSIGSVKRRGFTEHEVKYARDLCNLCHAALRCFSNIAVVPVLYSIFTDEQLSDILTDVLAIPLASFLPTPNARKTCQVVMWTLQMQFLPSVVLRPAADRITYAIRRGVDGELGREGKQGSIVDGLKAIGNLTSRWPEVFLTPMSDIIPSVLANLLSQNNNLRVEAAHTLLKVSSALAKATSTSPATLPDFSRCVLTFLTEQHQRKRNPQDISPLNKALSICFNSEFPAHLAHSPAWALSVIASLIVLSGGDALLQPGVIKFIIGHLQTTITNKNMIMRAFGALVWRAFIWATVRLDKSDVTEDKKDSAWNVVCQIVDAGVGVSIVAASVGLRTIRDRRLYQALQVVRVMIKRGRRTCEAGVNVLAQLTSGIVRGNIDSSSSPLWTEQSLLVDALFDGTLLRTEWKQLSTIVRATVNKNSVVSDIPCLKEEEVIQYWDLIFDTWKEGIEKAPLGSNGDVPKSLLNTWQALLLIQARLNHSCDGSDSEPPFILRLRDVLASFLVTHSLDWSLNPNEPSWASQTLKLGLVHKLWVIVTDIFPAEVLDHAASYLISQILEHEYSLGQERVRTTWAALCAELLLVVSTKKITSPWKDSLVNNLTLEVRIHLWTVVCKLWIQRGKSYTGVGKLLSIPFTFHQTRFEDYLQLWTQVIDAAFVAAAGRNVSRSTVLDSIARELEPYHDHEFLWASLPSLLRLTHHPSVVDEFPMTLLRLIGYVLVDTYGASNPEHSFAILSEVTQLIKHFGHASVSNLCVIQDGVSNWVENRMGVITDEEYNDQVIPLYIASLEALASIPPSIDTLRQFAPLISSAFSRIPEPALGPSAFKAFWLATYRSFDFSVHICPEKIKPILRSIQEAMCTSGEVLVSNLSQETQTQSLRNEDVPLTTVPDSLECNEAVIVPLTPVPIQTSAMPGPHLTSKTVDCSSGIIKKEIVKNDSLDFDAVIESRSSGSQASKRSHLGKRRSRHWHSNKSSKRRKSAPISSDVEIINVSDDDEGPPVEESIVVAKAQHRRASTGSTSVSLKKPMTPQTSQTQKFFVEIPKLNLMKEEVGTPSPCKRKRNAPVPCDDSFVSNKRHRLNKVTVKQEDVECNDVRAGDVFNTNNEDSGEHHTPVRKSDVSIPSSNIGHISGKHILSPEPRRFRSDAYDPPSDDAIPSSPLRKLVARRRRQRTSVAPLPLTRRVPSGEYLALEQAHVAITSGSSRMEVHELLEATRMANGISMALNDQMARKLSSGPSSGSD